MEMGLDQDLYRPSSLAQTAGSHMDSVQGVLRFSIQLQRRRTRACTSSWPAFTSVPASRSSKRHDTPSLPTSHIDRDLMAQKWPPRTHIGTSIPVIHPDHGGNGEYHPWLPCLVPRLRSLVEHRFPFPHGQRWFYHQAAQGHHVHDDPGVFLRKEKKNAGGLGLARPTRHTTHTM